MVSFWSSLLIFRSNFGTSLPLKSHIILSPTVRDRAGAQWHKYPLLTNDFEARFTLFIKGDQQPDKVEQGFAFWCVKDNVTQVMPDHLRALAVDVTTSMKSAGWGLFGFKETFEGFGVIFSYQRRLSNGELELKPSVSVVTNDGTKIITTASIPTTIGSFWNFRSFTKMDVKLRVKPDGILVEAKPSGSASWTKLAEVAGDARKFASIPGQYLGFTSFVGTAGKPTATADEIIIDNLVLENMDLSQQGEETVSTPPPATLSDEDILQEKGEVGEMRAVRALARAVFRSVTEGDQPRKALVATVRSLASRIEGIEAAVKKLKDELMLVSGHDMDKDFALMKEQVLSLSKEAAIGSQQKRGKLEELHKDFDTKGMHTSRAADELAQSAEELKRQTSSSSSTLFMLVGVGAVIVLVAGVGMTLKFTSWEKKHLL